MTVIVGYIAGDGTITMGGDSSGLEGSYNSNVKQPKIVRLGKNREFIIGFAGYFRLSHLLQYKFTPPVHPEGMDTHEYMATLFVDALKKVVDKAGFMKREASIESLNGSTLLVGYRERLFTVEACFQVFEADASFYAIGCGRWPALGAMDAMSDSGYDSRRRVHQALKTSERWCQGVSKPFHIEQLQIPKIIRNMDRVDATQEEAVSDEVHG